MDILEDTNPKVGSKEPDFALHIRNSVFKGEVPFITFTNDNGEGVIVGRLWGTGGKFSFEGNVDESARIFFEQVIELNRKMLEQ